MNELERVLREACVALGNASVDYLEARLLYLEKVDAHKAARIAYNKAVRDIRKAESSHELPRQET